MADNHFDDDVRSIVVNQSVSDSVTDPLPAAQPPSGRALPAGIDLGSYEDIAVTLDPDNYSYWLAFRPRGVPCFTTGMLRELNKSHRMIHQLIMDKEPDDPAPIKFFISCSDTPGVFSYGGDLALFKRCIRERDRVTLLAYAYACVEAMFNNAFGFDVPVISVGVIEGDALGGGFEAALSINVLIAERGVKMGLPEVLFNSFPGMGAYSFLSRKLDPAKAERLILSGKVFLAEELHEMGVVDILAERGGGRDAAREFVKRNQRRHSVLHALNKVRRKVHPLTLEELRAVTEIWVDTAMALDESELRKMEILRTAQMRAIKRSAAVNARF